MPKINYRKLIPLPALLILVLTGIFFILVFFGKHIEDPKWIDFTKGIIIFLLVLIFIYVILDFFLKKYILKIISPPKQKDSAQEQKQPSFKKLVEEAVPAGYKLEVSLEKGFSFCYPEDWEVVEVKDALLYMQIKEKKFGPGMSMLRNFNISHQNIEGVDTDFLFKTIISAVVRSLNKGVLDFKEQFETEDTFGMRYKINYKTPKNHELSCYQIAITNKNKKSLVLLTFTTGINDFQRGKGMFNKLAELVKIYN